MNSEIRTQWVEALRSSEYKQIKERLHDGADGFCVVGVLCELHRQAHDGEWKEFTDYTGSVNFTYLTYFACIPQEVAEWADCSVVDFRLFEGEYVMKLNDEGKTFEELADMLEQEKEKQDA